MTNSKSTKRALLFSVLSVMMCVAMLIGTTFAWFTDTASTNVNKIQAGNLKVGLEMSTNGTDWVDTEGKVLNFVKAAGHENEEILWEPGCEYKLPYLRVVNKGNLALKYVIKVTGINGDAKLNEVIDWTITTPTDCTLNAGTESDKIEISGKMQTTAGNEYQGLSINGISVTVIATQATVEYDSNDNQYDKDAQLPSVWDGSVATSFEAEVDGQIKITSAAEFAKLMKDTQGGNSLYNGKTFVLDCDIDFAGRTITGVGSEFCNITFTFDGNGHTISNFKIENQNNYYAGLFQQLTGTVKDLTVENATVIGNKIVGVIASNANNGSVTGCTVKNSTVVARVKKAGAIVGYIYNGTVTGCVAENTNVYCSNTETAESGEVIGYVDGTSNVDNNNRANNVNVYRGVTPVSTVAELKNALADPTNGGEQPARTIVINNDLDMSDWNAISIATNYPSVTIEGNGHVLKNLSAPLFKDLPGRFYNFNNITVDSANIGTDFGSAFVGEFKNNAGGKLSFVNCNVNNSNISATTYAGAFVGYAADGGDIAITDCTVSNTTVNTTNSSCGAFIGHTKTTTEITNGKVIGNTNVKCAEHRNGSAAKAGWFIGTIQGATTITGCTNSSTGELSNNNALVPIENDFIGRNVDGSVTVR